MIEKLFSYGTLQMENVQLETFGRKLTSHPDLLLGYEMRDCIITDQKVIHASGKSVHPIACFTGDVNNVISGTVLQVTAEELQQADRYEVADYERVKCTLKSGKQAWVYVKKALSEVV